MWKRIWSSFVFPQRGSVENLSLFYGVSHLWMLNFVISLKLEGSQPYGRYNLTGNKLFPGTSKTWGKKTISPDGKLVEPSIFKIFVWLPWYNLKTSIAPPESGSSHFLTVMGAKVSNQIRKGKYGKANPLDEATSFRVVAANNLILGSARQPLFIFLIMLDLFVLPFPAGKWPESDCGGTMLITWSYWNATCKILKLGTRLVRSTTYCLFP